MIKLAVAWPLAGPTGTGPTQRQGAIMSIRRRTAGAALALALAGSAAGVITTAVPASADAGGNAALQFCRSIAQYFPGNITGPCVSSFQSMGNASATTAYICKTQFVPAGEFATVGECVRTINALTGK